MRILLVTILLVISMTIVFIFASNSSAQNHDGVIGKEPNLFPQIFHKNMTCSESDFVYDDLKNKQQTKVWWGLTKGNKLAELFLNLNTGTWFFMLSSPENISCGLIGGEMSVPYDKNPYFK